VKIVVLIFALFFPFLANAQEREDNKRIIYKQRTEINFDGVDVQGELVKPQGTLLLDRRSASFNPLIKLRENWNLEIKESIRIMR
jgi:tRNA1(Val) A37 N6-methylase TrmN6